ncbi:MAG: tetratricopeptide repeat protein, partial [Candidatus Methylomirabilales bacterium]
LGDDALLGHGLAAKAVAHWVFTERRESAEAGGRAVELLREAGDLWRLVAASGFLVLSLVYLGRFEEALRVGQEFGPLAERLGNSASMMQHRRSPALVDLFTTGDVDRFEAFAADDRDFCQRAGLPWVSTAWLWLGWCRYLKGDWDAAVPLLEEAVRRDPPGTAFTGWSAGVLFECLAYRGDKPQALAVLEGRPFPALGEPKTSTAVVVALGATEGLTVLGERERAAALYPSIVDIWERAGVPCPSYDGGRLVQRAAGIAAFAGRDYDPAEAHFRLALEQAAAIPHRIEEAHTRRWYGRMLLERDRPGDRDRAAGVLRASVADFQRMGMPKHREMSERLLAEA